MPDPYIPLPDDDESPPALVDDACETFATDVAGWARSDAALEVALMAAVADEGSTLYALLREDADDRFADFGADLLGVPANQDTPATTTATWTAAAAAPGGGYTIEAGQQLAITGQNGDLYAFEVVTETVIDEGDTEAAGVIIQAVVAGYASNFAEGNTAGSDGRIEFDEYPSWLLSVETDAPAAGGADADGPDEHRGRIRSALQNLSRVLVLPADFERAAQESTVVARALVRDNFDATTHSIGQERMVSVFPVGYDGELIDSGELAIIDARMEARRETNFVVHVAQPTLNEIDVDITVTRVEGAVAADVQDRVEAAIAAGPLSPALHGQVTLGERRTFQYVPTLRRYEVVFAARSVEDVLDINYATVELNGVAADLTMTGDAPLPTPGTITVTVVDPA